MAFIGGRLRKTGFRVSSVYSLELVCPFPWHFHLFSGGGGEWWVYNMWKVLWNVRLETGWGNECWVNQICAERVIGWCQSLLFGILIGGTRMLGVHSQDVLGDSWTAEVMSALGGWALVISVKAVVDLWPFGYCVYSGVLWRSSYTMSARFYFPFKSAIQSLLARKQVLLNSVGFTSMSFGT